MSLVALVTMFALTSCEGDFDPATAGAEYEILVEVIYATDSRDVDVPKENVTKITSLIKQDVLLASKSYGTLAEAQEKYEKTRLTISKNQEKYLMYAIKLDVSVKLVFNGGVDSEDTVVLRRKQ